MILVNLINFFILKLFSGAWELKYDDDTSDAPSEILKDVLWSDDNDIFAKNVGAGEGLRKAKIRRRKNIIDINYVGEKEI